MPRRISRKDTKRKRRSGPKNKIEESIPRKTPEKNCVDTKEKGNLNLLKSKEKASGSGEHKANGQRVSAEEAEGNWRKWEKGAQKPKSHHYHKTYDGDKALTNPTPNRHMEIASDTRSVIPLAHAHRTQGLGGN